MGSLKTWFARKAGPSAYGNQMGNAAVENGTMLGRALYASHGVRAGLPEACIFNGPEDMRVCGFDLYSSLNTSYRSGLFLQSVGACIAFSAFLSMNAAEKYFRHHSNKSNFCEWVRRGVIMTLKKDMDETLQATMEYLEFLGQIERGGQLVNLTSPGDSDVFLMCLTRIGSRAEKCTVGFPRSVFGELVVDLSNQTFLGVNSAATQFDW